MASDRHDIIFSITSSNVKNKLVIIALLSVNDLRRLERIIWRKMNGN